MRDLRNLLVSDTVLHYNSENIQCFKSTISKLVLSVKLSKTPLVSTAPLSDLEIQMCVRARRLDPAAVQHPVRLQGRLHRREEGGHLQPVRGRREHQRAGRGGEEAGRARQ